jgi:aerobic carbon-monoxide dehydrogenase medium subunit
VRAGACENSLWRNTANRGSRPLKLVPGLGLIATSIRTLAPVRLYRPSTGEQIARILAGETERPTLVAGGTDLCAQFNDGLAPRSLVALDRVAALQRIERLDGEIRIGSGVTHAAGRSDPLINRYLDGFAAAWGAIANVRVRFRATIGGNLMALRPRYEMSAILDALDAMLCFRTADRVASLAPGDLWNSRAPARSFLQYVSVPAGDDFIGFRYDRSLRPVMTLAVCMRRSGGVLSARVVIATEMLSPIALVLPRGPSLQDLKAMDYASAAAAALPEHYADQNASNWYLRRVTASLLHRQLKDLGQCLTTTH